MKRGRSNIDDSRYPLFITTTITEFIPVFRDSDLACEVLRILETQRRRFEMEVFSYVLMPSHMHMMTQAPVKGITSSFMGAWKSLSAAAILKASPETIRLRFATAARKYHEPSRKSHKVWMSRFDDVALCQADTFVTKLEYIHRNPVKAEIVERAEDYQFSSAAFYARSMSDPILQITDCRPLLAGRHV